MMGQQILLQRRKNWAKKAHCRYFALHFAGDCEALCLCSANFLWLCWLIYKEMTSLCSDSSGLERITTEKLPQLNLISIFPNNKLQNDANTELPKPALPLMSTRGADSESVFKDFPAEMKKYTAWYRKLFGLYDVCGVGVYTNSVF